MRVVRVEISEQTVVSEASGPLTDTRSAAQLLAAILGTPVVPPVVVPPAGPVVVSLARATALLQALAAICGVGMEADDPQHAVEKAARPEYANEADPLVAVIEAEFRPQYLRRRG